MALELVLGTLNRALAYGTPLLLATLGEIYVERAGVLNLGIEGMMMLGAFSSFCVAYLTSNPWLGILTGAIAGGLFSLIHAFSSVTLRANQTVSGLALTMLGTGIAETLGRSWEGKGASPHLSDPSRKTLSLLPLSG